METIKYAQELIKANTKVMGGFAVMKEIREKKQKVFNYFSDRHDVILLESDLDELFSILDE